MHLLVICLLLVQSQEVVQVAPLEVKCIKEFRLEAEVSLVARVDLMPRDLVLVFPVVRDLVVTVPSVVVRILPNSLFSSPFSEPKLTPYPFLESA